MNRILTVLIAIAVLVSVTGPAMALASPAETPSTDADPLAQTSEPAANNTSAPETSPGAMFAGSVSVQHQEIQGELEHRSFGLQVAAAASNNSTAQVLNHTQERLQQRLAELEQEQTWLNESLANGTISEAQYQVRMSAVVTKSSNLERLANSTNQTAAMLPREILEANGVNVTALEHVRDRAHNMTGPETAAMARQIAGNSIGMPMGPPQERPGGPHSAMPGNRTAGDENDTRMGGGNGPDDRMMGQPTTRTTTTTNTTGTTTIDG